EPPPGRLGCVLAEPAARGELGASKVNVADVWRERWPRLWRWESPGAALTSAGDRASGRQRARRVQVIDGQDRVRGNQGRVRPAGRRLAGPDFDGRLRGDDAEHGVAAGPIGSSGRSPAPGGTALLALPPKLANDGPVDMAAAMVGKRSRRPGA